MKSPDLLERISDRSPVAVSGVSALVANLLQATRTPSSSLGASEPCVENLSRTASKLAFPSASDTRWRLADSTFRPSRMGSSRPARMLSAVSQIGPVIAGLSPNGQPCGELTCGPHQFCQVSSFRCRPCTDVCTRGHKNFQQSTCFAQCQGEVTVAWWVEGKGLGRETVGSILWD